MSVNRYAPLAALVVILGAHQQARSATYEAPLDVRRTAKAEFAEKPRVVRKNGSFSITFSVSAATDVEVAVFDAKGKVVRHLAAGLLGKHAPAPFKKDSLSQEVKWDGRDDRGRPASGAPFEVRVRLGLGAELERFMPKEPFRTFTPTALGVGPGGEIYVLANRGKGSVYLYALDREGKYLRTILPGPANLKPEQLEGMPRLKREDGAAVPFFYHAHCGHTAPYLAGVRSQQLAVSKDGLIAIASGGNDYVYQAVPRHALLVRPDGSTPPEVGFVGPELGPHRRYSGGLRPQQLAFAPDGKTVYFAGMGVGGRKPRGIHTIGRFVLGSGKKPEPFVGKPDQAGDGKLLRNPVSVTTDAKGNLYVADVGNKRVAAFDPRGKYLGQTGVERPRQVCVHPSGAMYVLTSPAGRSWVPFDLIKFDKAVGGKEVARLKLRGKRPIFTLDPGAKPPRLWLSYSPGWRRLGGLLPVTDNGNRLVPGEDALARKKGVHSWQMGMLFMALDVARNRLYLSDFAQSARRKIVRVDLETGEMKDFIEASEVALDRDGNLYALHRYRSNKVLRFDPGGKPLPFTATGSNSITVKYRAGGPDHGVRGLTVAPGGDIYVWQDNKRTKPEDLWVFGPDGKLKRKDAIAGVPADSGNGLAVDRAGNIYAGVNVHDPKRLRPRWLEKQMPPLVWYRLWDGHGWYNLPDHGVPKAAPWSRTCINNYFFHYGTVFKFPPEGGRFWAAGRPSAAGNRRPENVPPGATEYRSAYLGQVVWGKEALWGYKGFSLCPNMTENWGDPACSCFSSRFCLDGYDRLLVPDVFRCSVGVLDSAGNEILRFGSYGNVDSAGKGSKIPEPAIPLAFPNAVAAAGGRAYVADRLNLRVAVIKLTHAAEATCRVR